MTTTTDRFTSADLDRLDLPAGWHGEIIDGELYVSKAPGWAHQQVCVQLITALNEWSTLAGLGRTGVGPGVLFAPDQDVIPDVVWASNERIERGLDEAGHFSGVGPELVVEVLSPGAANERRDREAKLRLYSSQASVLEYWICDPRTRTVEIYRRQTVAAVGSPLVHAELVSDNQLLTSPLLPGFQVTVSRLLL